MQLHQPPANPPRLVCDAASVNPALVETTLVEIVAAGGYRLPSMRGKSTVGSDGVNVCTLRLYYTDENDVERLLVGGGVAAVGTVAFDETGFWPFPGTAAYTLPTVAAFDTLGTHQVKKWRLTGQFSGGAGAALNAYMAATEAPTA